MWVCSVASAVGGNVKHAPKYTIKVDTGLETIIELKNLSFRAVVKQHKRDAGDTSQHLFGR